MYVNINKFGFGFWTVSKWYTEDDLIIVMYPQMLPMVPLQLQNYKKDLEALNPSIMNDEHKNLLTLKI